jgi:UDP-glucose 4-epimerase
VLITGGAGFLGRSIARALRERHEVWLGSRDHEANAAAERATECRALPLDVTSIDSVRDVLAEVQPDLLVHAAAAKYVGFAERHPMECVDVNVRGTQNVARAAVERGLAGVVGISTDKAAPPVSSLYGLSKALGERLFSAMDAKSETAFASVRLGNIAWSPGSVFWEWTRMQRDGGPIRSTGPDMRRYLLSATDGAAVAARALEHIEAVRGSILARRMEVARIRDVLDVWTEEFGGTWEQAECRAEDNVDEWLVGEPEAPHTQEQELGGGTPCLVISPRRAVAAPLSAGLSTASGPPMERDAIWALLSERPH